MNELVKIEIIKKTPDGYDKGTRLRASESVAKELIASGYATKSGEKKAKKPKS